MSISSSCGEGCLNCTYSLKLLGSERLVSVYSLRVCVLIWVLCLSNRATWHGAAMKTSVMAQYDMVSPKHSTS